MSDLNIVNTPDTIIKTPKGPECPDLTAEVKFDNKWNIYQIATLNTPKGWERAFKNSDDELQHISMLLERDEQKNGNFYPHRENIFKAFHLTSLDDLKAVIVCPEPYSTMNTDNNPLAVGLSLAVTRTSPIPFVLQKFFNILAKNNKNFVIPMHGDLTEWAKNGILLLNISLTVRSGTPKSHSELWTGFTSKIINEIMSTKKYVPFICIGKDCNKIANFISGSCPLYRCMNPYSMDTDFEDLVAKINEFFKKHNLEPLNLKISE
jgi:uracil-DNA glycosylase